MAKTFNPKKSLEYNLEVGESLILKTRFLDNTLSFIYAGMPSKEVFSIVAQETEFSLLSDSTSAKNLFYSVSQKEIKTYDENKFEVLSVDAEKIKLKYLGEK